MSANLENSAVATGLEKVSFHSSPKERQCQKIFILPYNCTHFPCYEGYAQNPSNQASEVCELRTYIWTDWVEVVVEEPEIKLLTFIGSWRKQGSSRKASASLTMLNSLTVWNTTNWKILKEMGLPNNLICFLKNLYAGQKKPVRIRYGTTDWFKIEKGVRQDYILSPCLFNLYAECISEMPGWMNHKPESRLLGQISTTSDMQMIPL